MPIKFRGFVAVLLAVMLAVSCVSVIGSTEVYASDDEVIHFPDTNLKKALIAKGLDLNGDSEISRGEMAGYGLAKESSTLELTNSGITNLSGMEYAVNLKNLVLNQNPLENLSPLKDLNRLEMLTLRETNVKDISPLARLTKLRFLDLFRTKVLDIGPVSTMSSLGALSISYNKISDLSPVANLKNLISIQANDNNIQDISALSTIPYLREVNISNNQVTDLSPLAHSTSMDRLYFSSNQIKSILPLAQLTNLKEVYFEDNQISDLTPLANLKMLEYISFDANRITDISVLSQLSTLKVVTLNENNISDLKPLANLTSLKSLELGWNRISDIGPLENLNALTYLVLASNQIKDISSLKNMSLMRELILSNNLITDISVLSGLLELVTLELTENPLGDVSILKKLTKLKYLKMDDHYKNSLQVSVAGVMDGGYYSSDVKIMFEKGQAKLNGKPVTSGTVISEEGSYALELSEVAGIAKTIHFIIDKTPPIVKGVSQGGIYHEEITIIHNEGEALLNGLPVGNDFWVDQIDGSSNHRIRVGDYGNYTLVVTDLAGNQTTINFMLLAPDYVVRGVTDKGVYNSEKVITFSDATATLNGKPYSSGEKVSEYGDYTLVVTGKNNVITIIHFRIQSDTDNNTTPDITFKDVSNWAEADIRHAQSMGLSDPVADLSFVSLITREKFSEVAVKLYEALTGTKTVAFSDNPFKDTNNVEIVKAYHLGIVTGTSTTQFTPNALITREQLAVMLKRVLDQANVSILYGSKKTFDDQEQFSTYAVEAIDFLSSIEVVKGLTEHTFGSKQNASIEQAIVMAMRIHDLTTTTDTNVVSEETPSDNGLFGEGSMFMMYVKEVVQYPGVEGTTNIYALKNERGFTLPAYSAIYVTATNDKIPPSDSLFGTLVIANSSDRPKDIKADSIDLSLKDLYSDRWGTITHPDGKTEVMRSTGPYLRIVTFIGPINSEKSLSDYYAEDKVLDLGSWFTVRHAK